MDEVTSLESQESTDNDGHKEPFASLQGCGVAFAAITVLLGGITMWVVLYSCSILALDHVKDGYRGSSSDVSLLLASEWNSGIEGLLTYPRLIVEASPLQDVIWCPSCSLPSLFPTVLMKSVLAIPYPVASYVTSLPEGFESGRNYLAAFRKTGCQADLLPSTIAQWNVVLIYSEVLNSMYRICNGQDTDTMQACRPSSACSPLQAYTSGFEYLSLSSDSNSFNWSLSSYATDYVVKQHTRSSHSFNHTALLTSPHSGSLLVLQPWYMAVISATPSDRWQSVFWDDVGQGYFLPAVSVYQYESAKVLHVVAVPLTVFISALQTSVSRIPRATAAIIDSSAGTIIVDTTGRVMSRTMACTPTGLRDSLSRGVRQLKMCRDDCVCSIYASQEPFLSSAKYLNVPGMEHWAVLLLVPTSTLQGKGQHASSEAQDIFDTGVGVGFGLIIVMAAVLALLLKISLRKTFEPLDKLSDDFKLVSSMSLDGLTFHVESLSFWKEFRCLQEEFAQLTETIRVYSTYLPASVVHKADDAGTRTDISSYARSPANTKLLKLQLGLGVLANVSILRGKLSVSPPFTEDELDSFGHLLSSWISAVSKVVLCWGGSVEYVLGEVVIISFGTCPSLAPVSSVTLACETALSLARSVSTMQRQSFSSMTTLSFSCGVSNGPVICGNGGTEAMRHRTLTGCTVEIAASLQRLAHVYKLGVVIEQTEYLPVSSSFCFREVDRLSVTAGGCSRSITVLTVSHARDSNITDSTLAIAWEDVEKGKISKGLSTLSTYCRRNPEDSIMKSVMEGIVVYYSRYGDGMPYETKVAMEVTRQPRANDLDSLLSPIRVSSPTTKKLPMSRTPVPELPPLAFPSEAPQLHTNALVKVYMSYLVFRRGSHDESEENTELILTSFYENMNAHGGIMNLAGDQLAAQWSCQNSKRLCLSTALGIRQTVSITDGSMGLSYDSACEGSFVFTNFTANCIVGDVIAKSEALAGMALQCSMAIVGEAVFKDVVPDVWWRMLCPEGTVLMSKGVLNITGIVQLDAKNKTDKYYTLGINAMSEKDYHKAKLMFQNSLDIEHDGWTLEIHSAVTEGIACNTRNIKIELTRSGDYLIRQEVQEGSFAGSIFGSTQNLMIPRNRTKRGMRKSLEAASTMSRRRNSMEVFSIPPPVFKEEKQLVVILDNGNDLCVADITSSDPYVVVTFNGQHQRSTTVYANRTPKWQGVFNNEDWSGLMFVFPLKEDVTRAMLIEFSVYDEDLIGNNDFMGGTALTLGVEEIDCVLRTHSLKLRPMEYRMSVTELGTLGVRVVAGGCQEISTLLEAVKPPPLLSFDWIQSRQIIQSNLDISRPKAQSYETTRVNTPNVRANSQSLAWKMLRAIVLLYNCARIPARVVFSTVESEAESEVTLALFCLDYCFDVVYWIELWNTFRRPYSDQGQKVTDRVAIASHYLHNWFTMDVIACFPWELVWAIWNPVVLLEKKWLRANRCLNLLRFKSLVEELIEDFSYGHPVVIEICVFLLLLCYYLLWMGCVWGVMFGKMESNGSDVISMYLFGRACGEPSRQWDEIPLTEKVVIAFHWALRGFSGYGAGWPGTDTQHVALLLINITGVAVFASVIAYVQKLISILGTVSTTHFNKMEEISETITYLHLPEDLGEEILRYYRRLYIQTKQAEQGQFAFLSHELPGMLWKELSFHVNKNLVELVPELRSSNVPFITSLVSKLEERFEAPGDILVERGDVEPEGIFFIVRGTARATLNGLEVERLGPGDFWGEVSVILGGPQIATVEVLEYAEIFVLPHEDAQLFLAGNESRLKDRAVQRRDRIRLMTLRVWRRRRKKKKKKKKNRVP